MSFLELRDTQKKFVSKDLMKLNPDEELLLIAFGITNPLSISRMQDDWKKSDSKEKAVGRDASSTKKIRPIDFGGTLTLIRLNKTDPTEVQTLCEMDILMPMGLCFDEDHQQLLVGSAFGIFTVKEGSIINNLKHNLFSQVHGISKTSRGFIAACTNTDSVVEFEIKKGDQVKEIWKWIAPQNGYTLDTRGNTRVIDPQKNYQFLDEGGTRTHTTHVNSVIEYNNTDVLITLFHQDQLIKVDRLTNEKCIIFSGMTNLHHIKKDPAGDFFFSATRRSACIFLNNDLKIKKTLEKDFDWVQDCELVSNYIVVSDNNNSRLAVFDNEYNYKGEITWSNDIRKVSNLLRVTASQAYKIFGI
jgi:hypothetical protein